MTWVLGVLLVAVGAIAGAAGFACARARRRGALLERALAAGPALRQLVASDGSVLFANPACAALFGADARPLPALVRAAAVSPDAEGEIDRLTREARGGRTASAALSLRLSGGAGAGATEVSCRLWATPLAGGEGQVLWAVLPEEAAPAAEPDAAEREAAAAPGETGMPAAAAAPSADGFRRFFDLAPTGFALVERGGAVRELNDALLSLAGFERSQTRGLALADLVRERDRPAVAEALASEEAAPIEVTMARGDTVCDLHLTRPEDGTDGLIAHFIDTTERKSLEAQFAQSQKMQAVGQLAGGIAHDFNNLLTAMIGFSDLLLLRHRPGDQSFADIMQIRQNANRAASLVRQLLAFSRQQTLQPRVLDVTDILAELSHLLRRLIGETIELKMIHGRDLGPVKADQGQLEQVIMNLAVNARDAMADGGTLTIETDNVRFDRPVKRRGEVVPAGEYTRIRVSDTGCGIAPEALDRIFEPFYSTKEVGAGTGLGLSTVYGIVSQTGGFVDVESTLGQGTCFSIHLPHHVEKAGARPGAPAPAEPSRDLTGMGTVMLVEDEDAVRAFGARALRNKGYNVIEADSGEAALEMLANGGEPVDLLVTDVVMPRLDGPSLVREVRRTHPAMKVIFISGYAEDNFRRRLGEETDIHFLPKPFSLKDLAGKVKEVMGEAAA